MKTSAIVRIVLFSIATVLLMGILVTGLGIGLLVTSSEFETLIENVLHLEIPTNNGIVASTGSVPASQIKDIEIEWAVGAITIQPGDTDEITFAETADLREEDKLVWEQNGDKLTIKFCKTQVFFGVSIDYTKDLVITVPRDWICDKLTINAASAKVEVSDLNIREVDFNGASGTCTFENCAVDEIDLDTAFGDVEFYGTLNVLEYDAASASCTAVLRNIPKKIDIDTASGDLDLTLPEDCGFTIHLDTMSGGFSSDFATTTLNGNYVYGDGSCRIDVDAMSGDVAIRKG